MQYFQIMSEINVNITITDVLAVWGAFVASMVLIWDIIKWKKSGPQVSFEVQANSIMVNVLGVDSDRNVTSFRVFNKGDRAITISNIGFIYYENYFQMLFRKPSKTCVFNPLVISGTIPYFLEIGKCWDGCLY